VVWATSIFLAKATESAFLPSACSVLATSMAPSWGRLPWCGTSGPSWRRGPCRASPCRRRPSCRASHRSLRGLCPRGPCGPTGRLDPSLEPLRHCVDLGDHEQSEVDSAGEVALQDRVPQVSAPYR
jgi:hypothetical protein